MHITVEIVCVDGVTCYELVTDNAAVARNFLSVHDHVGSSVTVRLAADNEDAYRLLDSLVTPGPDTRSVRTGMKL